MIIKILKRDGRIEFFEKDKITEAIFKAAQACGGKDKILSATLADLVVKAAEAKFNDKIPTVEDIQDIVEEVLINEGHAQTAKAYILYRERSALQLHLRIAGLSLRLFHVITVREQRDGDSYQETIETLSTRGGIHTIP